MIDKLLDRLCQPETWRGIIYIVTAAGVTVDPAMANTIIAAGLGLSGIIHVLWEKQHATPAAPKP